MRVSCRWACVNGRLGGRPVANEKVETDLFERVTKSLEPIEKFAKWFYRALAVLIIFFSIAVGFSKGLAVAQYGAGFRTFLLTLAISAVVAVTATGIGSLLGFLFGIPRSLQGSGGAVEQKPADGNGGPSAARADTTRAFLSNTSLEEISDWLTKIIIGLGLVQFQLLIDYLYRAALYAASFVAGERIEIEKIPKLDYDPAVATPFYFGLIVVSLIAGCLLSYLETRTRLMLLFIDAENANKERARDQRLAVKAGDRPVAIAQESDTPGKPSPPAAPLPAEPTDDDRRVANIPRADLQDTKALIGWASAQARTGNFDQAERALRDALQKDPNDDSIRERILEVLHLKSDAIGAVKMMEEIADRSNDPKKRYDLLRRALYEALYAPPPDGFEEAIKIYKKLFQMPEAQRSAIIHVWAAAALGQKYGWLKDRKNPPPDENELKNIWNEALALCTKVVEELTSSYDASERELMRSLYEGTIPGEDDLSVFKSDEFDAVIYKGKP